MRLKTYVLGFNPPEYARESKVAFGVSLVSVRSVLAAASVAAFVSSRKNELFVSFCVSCDPKGHASITHFAIWSIHMSRRGRTRTCFSLFHLLCSEETIVMFGCVYRGKLSCIWWVANAPGCPLCSH